MDLDMLFLYFITKYAGPQLEPSLKMVDLIT